MAGIDFSALKTRKNTANKSAKDELPKSQFWLNMGYTVEGAGEDGEDVFISLPFGQPLDPMEHVRTSSKNENYRLQQMARNELLDQLNELAKSLEPGEEIIVPLQIQLRRINNDAPEVNAAENKFVRALITV